MNDLNECCLSAEKYIRLPTDTARQLYLYTEWVGAFRCAPSFRIRRSDWDSCLLLYTLSGMVAERRADLVVNSILKYVTDIDEVKGWASAFPSLMPNLWRATLIPTAFHLWH